jgi:hypothetical protein
MAIGTSDRDALVILLFETFDQNADAIARVLVTLERRFGTVTWRARIVALAPTYAPYVAARLEIAWFTSEISRLADAYK